MSLSDWIFDSISNAAKKVNDLTLFKNLANKKKE